MDVKFSWKTHDCVVPSRVNGKPELSNITVAIQDISGLDAHIGQEGLIDFQNGAAQELQLTLQLTASPELPVGRRTFLLKIDYDVLNRKGALYRQTIYTPIPVRVVGQNALVRKNRGPSEQWNPWELLALPVNILEYLVEALSGQIC